MTPHDWLMGEYETGVREGRRNPSFRMLYSLFRDIEPYHTDERCNLGRCQGTSKAAHTQVDQSRDLVPEVLWASEGITTE